MKPNKLACLLLALCMVLSLCACATQEKITVPKEEPKETTESPTQASEEIETTEAPQASEEAEATEAPTQASEETEPTLAADATLAEALIGTWDWEISLGQLLVEQLSQSLGMDMSDRAEDLELSFSFTFEFAEDGTCKGYFDEEKMTASFEDFIDGFCSVLTDVTYEMLADQGMTQEDAESQFVEQYGCGIEAYYKEILYASLNIETMFGKLPTIDSTYKLEGDQLTIAKDGVFSDDAATISIDGDVMTLDGFIDADLEAQFATFGMSLPFTMVRK